MEKKKVEMTIEALFRKTVQNDLKLKNAYLLVYSGKNGIDIDLAEGETDKFPAAPQQPNYMASVGKIFTSTIISILYEKGELSFDDSISKFLDQEILNRLHIYKGKDYTEDIRIRHLLNQTSGLYDDFRPLLDKLIDNPDYSISPKEAIIWAKENLETNCKPGDKLYYTDTNYHLLGLIIENITGKPFHEVLHQYIFETLDMKNSSMLHYSEAKEKSEYPMANFYYKGKVLNDIKGYGKIDYTGGGVVAPTEDLLKYMKALVSYSLISKDTMDKMLADTAKFTLGIDYSYGIWQIKTVPLLMPSLFNSWGVVGATGAFMFYHPALDLYLIGNFNDFAYGRKGIRFMLKLIKQISKIK